MKNFIFVLLVFLISFCSIGQTVIPSVNNVGGGSFNNTSYQLDFSIGETSIKIINSSSVQISEGVIQRTESTCNTPVLTISGSLSVCPTVSGFYSVKRPVRTSTYTWSISGQSVIVSGQGTSRIFVRYGATAQDLISVQETTKDGCVGPAYSVQLSPSVGRYATPDLNLNCSTTLVSIPVLAVSSIPSGVVAMDLTLGYDQLLMTPTGVSFLGNVVKQNFVNGAVNLYTDFTQLGLIKVSLSYSSLVPQTANFAGLGTIIGFNFNRTSAFVPGGSTALNIVELIEGNVSGVNYQCGTNGLISLRNNEISGILSHTNGRVMAYNPVNPTQFNPTTITATDVYCQPNSYSVNPDLTGKFRFNIDNGERIQIQRDIPGSYYSTANAINVQSVINSNDVSAIFTALKLSPLTFIESWKEIGRNPSKLASVYAMDVDMDGLVTSLDLHYVHTRSVLQIKEYPQVWNYTDDLPNNSTDLSKDWLFVDWDKFTQLASTLNTISILPTLDDCLSEPTPSASTCTPLGNVSYRGILLGDVDGNWSQAPLNSNLIRSSSENQLVVGLDSAISITGGYLIPLNVQHTDSIKAIDFYFDFDSTMFIAAQVSPTFDTTSHHFIWNNFYNRTVLAGAYSSTVFEKKYPLYYLKLLSSIPITEESFQEFKSYVNGIEVPVTFRQAVTTGTNTKGLDSFINIYPNPTINSIQIVGKNMGSGEINVELLNSTGSLVGTFNFISSIGDFHQEIDLGNVSPGVYFIKFKGEDLSKVIKLIKR